MVGSDVIATHSEENFDTNEMGLVTRFDASLKGEIKKDQTKWFVHGPQIGFPTPVVDEAAGVLYAVDNGAILIAFDLTDGHELWTKKLGTLQKDRLVADGSFIRHRERRFYILSRPDGGECSRRRGRSGRRNGGADGPERCLVAGRATAGYTRLDGRANRSAPKAKTARRPPRRRPPPGRDVALASVRVTLKPGKAEFARNATTPTAIRSLHQRPRITWAAEVCKARPPDGKFTPTPTGSQGARSRPRTRASPAPIALRCRAMRENSTLRGWPPRLGQPTTIRRQGPEGTGAAARRRPTLRGWAPMFRRPDMATTQSR